MDKTISLIVTACLSIGVPLASSFAEEAKAPASAETTPEPTPTPTLLSDTDFTKQTTYIKSDSLLVKSNERQFYYKGNVEVKQGDLLITSDLLEGTYTENNKVEKLVATKNVIVTKGEKIRANSERAVYTANDDTVVLTENPELQQEGSILTADVVKVFIKEDRSVAEGDVRVKLLDKGGSGFNQKLK